MDTMNPIALSPYGQASTILSPVAKMMEAFASNFRPTIDINLGVGYVNEQTIPTQLIEETLRYINRHPANYHAPFNYGDPAGCEHLLRALHDFYCKQHIGQLTKIDLQNKRFIVGASGATSLLDAMSQILKPGIVITTDPLYYIYCHQLERAGFELVTIPQDEQGLNINSLNEQIKKLGKRQTEISFVYIVSVGNPSCTILSNTRRTQLAQTITALSKSLDRKIPLIVDCAYELLVHDPEIPKPRSLLLDDPLGLVYELGTLSKIMAPTLRIGYLLGKKGLLMDALVQKISDTGFSAPLLSQEIAAHLLGHHIDKQLANVNQNYHQKAVQVKQWITQYLGDEVQSCSGGSAGFYFYLTFKQIHTNESSLFFKALSQPHMEKGLLPPRVIYIPGEFCVHQNGSMREVGKRQLRLSYGYESLPQIKQGLQRMGQVIAELKNNNHQALK